MSVSRRLGDYAARADSAAAAAAAAAADDDPAGHVLFERVHLGHCGPDFAVPLRHVRSGPPAICPRRRPAAHPPAHPQVFKACEVPRAACIAALMPALADAGLGMVVRAQHFWSGPPTPVWYPSSN